MKVKIRNRIPEKYYNQSKLSNEIPRELDDFFTLETSENLNNYLYNLRMYIQMGTSFIFEKIIKLEHSVLDHQELAVLFGRWNFYRELVKFNIFYRLIKSMECIEFNKTKGCFFVSIGRTVEIYFIIANFFGEVTSSVKLLEIKEDNNPCKTNTFLKFVLRDETINSSNLDNEEVKEVISTFNSCIIPELKKDELRNKPCYLFTFENMEDNNTL